jgi:hypothetical protein
MRRPTVQLGGRTVTSSSTTATGHCGGSAEHPCSGRSRVQLINLANIAVYVVARIVPVPPSGQASGEFQFTLLEAQIIIEI